MSLALSCNLHLSAMNNYWRNWKAKLAAKNYTRRDFWRSVVFGLIAFWAVFLTNYFFAAGYSFGVDVQASDMRCLPWKYYLLEKGVPNSLKRGEFVTAIPFFVSKNKRVAPLAKMVAGLPGDVFEVRNGKAYVNGMPYSDYAKKINSRLAFFNTSVSDTFSPLSLKNLNKKIEDFERKPTIVPNGYVLLMGTEPRSYDGRYWGFAPQKMVIDRAIPIL